MHLSRTLYRAHEKRAAWHHAHITPGGRAHKTPQTFSGARNIGVTRHRALFAHSFAHGGNIFRHRSSCALMHLSFAMWPHGVFCVARRLGALCARRVACYRNARASALRAAGCRMRQWRHKRRGESSRRHIFAARTSRVGACAHLALRAVSHAGASSARTPRLRKWRSAINAHRQRSRDICAAYKSAHGGGRHGIERRSDVRAAVTRVSCGSRAAS